MEHFDIYGLPMKITLTEAGHKALVKSNDSNYQTIIISAQFKISPVEIISRKYLALNIYFFNWLMMCGVGEHDFCEIKKVNDGSYIATSHNQELNYFPDQRVNFLECLSTAPANAKLLGFNAQLNESPTPIHPYVTLFKSSCDYDGTFEKIHFVIDAVDESLTWNLKLLNK